MMSLLLRSTNQTTKNQPSSSSSSKLSLLRKGEVRPRGRGKKEKESKRKKKKANINNKLWLMTSGDRSVDCGGSGGWKENPYVDVIHVNIE